MCALKDTEDAARRTYVEDDGKQVVFYGSLVGMFLVERGSSEWDEHVNDHMGLALICVFLPKTFKSSGQQPLSILPKLSWCVTSSATPSGLS